KRNSSQPTDFLLSMPVKPVDRRRSCSPGWLPRFRSLRFDEGGSAMPATTACRWRKRKLSCPENLESTIAVAETPAAIAAPFLLRFRYSVSLKNKMCRPADRPRGLRKRSGGERKRGTVDNRDRRRTAAPIREQRPQSLPRSFSLFAAPANAEQLPRRKCKQLHKWQPREEQSRVVDVSGRKSFRRAILATSQFRQSEWSRTTMRTAPAAASCNAAAIRGSDRQL